MTRSILVVDPNPTRRRMYQDALGARFKAYAVAHSQDVPASETFDIYWLSLRQSAGHGLEVGRDIKARDPRALVVVYGRADGQALPPRGKVERTWQIDVYVPYVPEASDLNATVDKALNAPRLGAMLAEVTNDPTSATNGSTARNARTTKTPGSASEPSWAQLLKAPVTGETLKQLMKKDLFSG